MKDMVPKGTGNSRFLRSSIPENITHEELVALLRAGTFPVDFAGLNPDGIATQGSAYNKANVLPDSVCTSMGIATNSEPKDAFNKLQSLSMKYRLLEKVTTSKNWICPQGVILITAILVGGGGGGSGCVKNEFTGGGGQGGAVILVRDIPVTPGRSYSITIGSGGTGGSPNTSNDSVKGSKGGSTTAFGFTAIGGDPGSGNAGGADPSAGSAGGGGNDFNVNTKGYYGEFGGEAKRGKSNAADPITASRVYTDLLFQDWYGAGGGGNEEEGGPNAGDSGNSSSLNGGNGTNGFGAGGGGGTYERSSGTYTYGSGGKGGSGAVLIYVRGD